MLGIFNQQLAMILSNKQVCQSRVSQVLKGSVGTPGLLASDIHIQILIFLPMTISDFHSWKQSEAVRTLVRNSHGQNNLNMNMWIWR